ncbi:MAG: ferredoxin-type protein NapF, partial [Sulfurovaceae bacterium]|nr:ferredoxin-type protein NapF [Sulfurovaceae bacterium]
MASRRDLFKSFTKPLVSNQEEEILLVRPPYGKDESIFQNKCPSCESKACVTSCDEKIIFI